MAADAKELCRVYMACQLAKPSNSAKQPLETFDTSGIGPGDLVAMDVATLPWADNSFRYFLCIVDVFTRYIEAIPLKDQNAISLVHEFENDWIYRGRRRGYLQIKHITSMGLRLGKCVIGSGLKRDTPHPIIHKPMG